MVDVKNKRCEEDMCMKRGLFGYEGEKARFCSRHRLEGQYCSRTMDSFFCCRCFDTYVQTPRTAEEGLVDESSNFFLFVRLAIISVLFL